MSKGNRASLRHGHARRERKTRIYNSWHGMLKRCRDKNFKEYMNYGGRGISVCERWRLFENFLMDMGDMPPAMTLDRINNDGNYEPNNCRWATRATQSRNSRQSRLYTFNGETLCLSDWAERLDLGRGTLQFRIAKGWPIQRIFSSVRKYGNHDGKQNRETQG